MHYRTLFTLFGCLLASGAALAQTGNAPAQLTGGEPAQLTARAAAATAASAPGNWLRFTRNDGQWEAPTRYRADLPGGFLHLEAGALHYILYDAPAVSAHHATAVGTNLPSANPRARATVRPASGVAPGEQLRAHGVRVTFVGANPAVRLEGRQPRATHYSYFLGNDRARWAADVPAYDELIYRDLYPGVDLRLFNHHNSLKYEFVVAAGADASQIRLRYEGADAVSLEKNELVVKTSLQTLRETQPYCYQRPFGKMQEVKGRFALKNNEVTFRFARGFDARLPLVIDPVLVFATYTGSVSDNWGHCATYDDAGHLYAGGTAFGNRFPVSTGAYQVNFSGQADSTYTDLALLKFSPDGTKLLYATYLGGTSSEVPSSLWVDRRGELTVLGSTSSTDFPVTANAFQRRYGGGKALPAILDGARTLVPAGYAIGGIAYPNGSDLLVAKLNAAGTALVGSTYLGGSDNDGVRPVDLTQLRNYGDQFRGEIITDAANRVYVVASSASADFPTVNGTRPAGKYDAVVARLNPDLSVLEWSTAFGSTELDAGYSLRLGSNNTVYVAGATQSKDLPRTGGTLNPQFRGGGDDGFVAQFQNDRLVAATYLGTDREDQAFLLDLDRDDNVFVFGQTTGLYPVTAGTYRNAGSGQFIHSLNPTLTQTRFSTVFGTGKSSPDITPTAFMVNDCGNLYLAGWGGRTNGSAGNAASGTTGLPVTAALLQPPLRSVTRGDDFYTMVLERDARSLLYGFFIGNDGAQIVGNHVDGGTSRFSKRGVIYQAVCNCGDSGFPTTPGAYAITNNTASNPIVSKRDRCNNALFKLDIDTLKASFDAFDRAGAPATVGCAPFTVRLVNTSLGGITYAWDLAGLATSTDPGGLTYTFNTPGDYRVRLVGQNLLTCPGTDTAYRVIRVQPSGITVSPAVRICPGESATLRADGGVAYAWTPAVGLRDLTQPNQTVTPTATTRYRVAVTAPSGCTDIREVLVEVLPTVAPAFEYSFASDACGAPVVVNFANLSPGGANYVWLMGNGDTLRTLEPKGYVYPLAGNYTVTLLATRNNCTLRQSQAVRVEQIEDPPNVITPNGDNVNDVFFVKLRTGVPNQRIGARGYKLEMYSRWGQLVHKADNYRNDWGMGVPNGTYYYLLTSPTGTRCKSWLEVLDSTPR